MMQIQGAKDIVGGGVLIVLALVLGRQSIVLPLGTSVRMGPGYFPLVLCVILVVLGLVILFRGFRSRSGPPKGIAWRGLGLILASVLFFAFALRPLGLIPTLTGTAFLATLASTRFHLKTAVPLTVGLVVFSWAVFVEGLGLPFVLFGPWIGG